MKNKLQIVQTPSGEKAVSEFPLIDENLLKSRIYTIRGVKVMLDADLAEIYGYSTKRFNEQVKCNIERFDGDFRFQLKKEEYKEILRSEKPTLEHENLRSEKPASSWGGPRYAPYAFTEQGIYMLMTVLKGEIRRAELYLVRKRVDIQNVCGPVQLPNIHSPKNGSSSS